MMVGRTADLGVLREVYDHVVLGDPAGVVVSGEAGIGKTRLISEWIDSVPRDTLVITAQCVNLGDFAVPYSPIIGLLRRLVDVLGADRVLSAAGPGRDALISLVPSLGELSEGSAGRGAGQTHETIAVLLEALATECPVVVVIEDLHWADGATLKLLAFLVKVLSGVPVMLVLSYRSGEVERGHPVRAFLTELDRTRRVVRHNLGRLSRSEVGSQAAAILCTTLSAADIDSVFARSEGVPFFVEELVGISDTFTGLDLPDSLRELLLARYEGLAQPTQRVLRLIAVGGAEVQHWLLEAVFAAAIPQAEPGELDVALRDALDSNAVLVQNTSYSLRHALLREAIHADLLPGERARFHRAFAQALEASPLAEDATAEISHHWMLARDYSKAFPATLTAMRRAHTSFGYSSEALLGERLLDIWDNVPDAGTIAGVEREELMRRTASALRNAGNSERALGMADLALCEPDQLTAELHARLLRDKASYLVDLGRSGSIEILQSALDLAPESDSSTLRGGILTALAARQMIAGNVTEAVQLADRAAAEAAKTGSVLNASIAANLGGVSRVHCGHLDEGLAMLAHSEELADGNGGALLRYRVNASDMANLLGRYEQAVELALEGITRAKALGVERSSGVLLSSNAIDPLIALGRWSQAQERLDRALSLDPPPAFAAYLRQSKVALTLWQGDPVEAARMYGEWRGSIARLTELEVQTRLTAASVAIQVALATGDYEAALAATDVLTDSRNPVVPGHALPLLADAARTAAALRARALTAPDAGRLMDELAEREREWRRLLADEQYWPTAPIWTAVFTAELSGPDGIGTDQAAWQAARSAANRPEAPALIRPYLDFRLGQALLTAGDRQAATAALNAAVAQATTLGALLIAEWATTVAERAGLTLGSTTRHRAAGDSLELTAREQQVLDLLADGLSNRQIGERLFISVKTASVHVSAILRKLGVSTRTEAAVMARVAAQTGDAEQPHRASRGSRVSRGL